MIKYNFRKKGQFEEDKFSLSILNMSNKLDFMLKDINKKMKKSDEIYNMIVESMDDGLYDRLYKESYKREV